VYRPSLQNISIYFRGDLGEGIADFQFPIANCLELNLLHFFHSPNCSFFNWGGIITKFLRKARKFLRKQGDRLSGDQGKIHRIHNSGFGSQKWNFAE
jgi:hypothetical protein